MVVTPFLISPLSCSLSTAREGAEVDVRSCVLSLIDLFSHWLTQPIHTLLLQHMLRAVLMLSDLFAMVHVHLSPSCSSDTIASASPPSSQSSQYEWMLQTATELQECHPPEDGQTTALLLQCILKAAAVLRVVSRERVTVYGHTLTSLVLGRTAGGEDRQNSGESSG